MSTSLARVATASGQERVRRPLATLLQDILELTGGMTLPDMMPARECRSVDAFVRDAHGVYRIIEFDEWQHFNMLRHRTLCLYPGDAAVGFPQDAWQSRCREKRTLEGGGFGAQSRHCSHWRMAGTTSVRFAMY